MSNSNNNRPCNYCGTILARFAKQPDGKWKRWDDKGNEHTYQACKSIQNNKSKGVAMPPPTTTVTGGGTSTFSQDKEPEVRGVTINSLFVKTSNLEKEVKDLRKQIETLETIADGIAQNVTLLVQNNYPKPEPAIEQLEKSVKDMEKAKELMDNIAATGEEAEAKSPYSKESVIESEPEVINPMRLDKDGWEQVSQAFVCHSCSEKCHNGYEKWGTLLCPTCQEGVTAQQSESSRTIEEINSEENSF